MYLVCFSLVSCQLGLEPHTPQTLIKGAKAIENRNKVLKKEVGSVEGETLALQQQFSRLVSSANTSANECVCQTVTSSSIHGDHGH